jgi:subtilisin family serine protease
MKTLKPLIALFALALVLGGCSSPGLNIGTVEMRGVLKKQVEIISSGYWQLDTSDSWLSAIPERGFGNAIINLSVNPTGLEPGEHTSGATLSLFGQPPQYLDVLFAFPKLRGSIVMGPAPADDPVILSAQSLSSGPGRLLVGLKDSGSSQFAPMSASHFRSLAMDVVGRRAGMRLDDTLQGLGVAVVEVSDMRAAAAALSGDPDVKYVEQDVPLKLLADYRAEQWAHQIMRVDEAWLAGGDGTGVNVAVIDAGFDAAHYDLDGNVIDTFDFESGTSSLTPRPNCGTHGEHVAGIVAAEAGLEGVDGVAAQAGVLMLNVGSGDPATTECPLYTSNIAEALDWVTNVGGISPRASVVNMSLGGPRSETLELAVERAYRAGITLVAASGNTAIGSVLYPAAYPEVVAVSATGRSDEIASYSTAGPEVFLSAPGGDGPNFILSTALSYTDNTVNYEYAYMQGTSMASPAVAAVAALAKSVNPNLTPVGIAGLLADSSVDLGDPGRDNDYGYGRVDAYAAVTRAETLMTQGEPAGYILRAEAKEWAIPAAEQFEVGYVGGTISVEVGSDDDWDGELGEIGEFYGTWNGEVEFTGEFFDVEIPVVKVQ